MDETSLSGSVSDDEYEDPEFQIVTIPDLESTWKMLTEIIVEF